MYRQKIIKGGKTMGAGNETIFDITETSEEDAESIHTPEK